MEKDSPCRGGSGAQLSGKQGRGESGPWCLACVLSTVASLPPTEAGRGRTKPATPAWPPRCVMPFLLSLNCLDEGELSCVLGKAWCQPFPGGPVSQGGDDLSPLFGGCCSGHPSWSGALQPALLQHGCTGAWTRRQRDTHTTIHHMSTPPKLLLGTDPHAPERSKAQHTSAFQVILLFFFCSALNSCYMPLILYLVDVPYLYIFLFFCCFVLMLWNVFWIINPLLNALAFSSWNDFYLKLHYSVFSNKRTVCPS